MGSVITSLPDMYDQVDLAGNKKPQMTYLQFVPGIVVSVVTSIESPSAPLDTAKVGSIRALPHIGGKGIKKKSMVGEEHRYWPLLRGMQDIPVKGDPVLLCTMGGRQYYLGPLNTEGKPNFNDDIFEYDELRSGAETGLYPDEEKTSPLFIEKDFKRLQKTLNPILDNPPPPPEVGNQGEVELPDWTSGIIHGDSLFEGRHGNSIRIGSRNVNPYIIISNGRGVKSAVETTLDGTIFSITHRGSIRQHFNRDRKRTGDEVGTENYTEPYTFSLADGELDKFDRTGIVYKSIAQCMTNDDRNIGHLGRGGAVFKDNDKKGANAWDSNTAVNWKTEDELYKYNKDQIFASSGRITFNARSDSIYLSALKRIHIGAGSSMTLSTSANILVEAAESVITNTGIFKVDADKFVYLDGREKIILGNPLKNDTEHAAVLGDALVGLLMMMMGEIKNLAYGTSEGIENRKVVGASSDIMDKVVEAFDQLMGKKTLEDGSTYPETLAELILSKKVFIKT